MKLKNLKPYILPSQSINLIFDNKTIYKVNQETLNMYQDHEVNSFYSPKHNCITIHLFGKALDDSIKITQDMLIEMLGKDVAAFAISLDGFPIFYLQPKTGQIIAYNQTLKNTTQWSSAAYFIDRMTMRYNNWQQLMGDIN